VEEIAVQVLQVRAATPAETAVIGELTCKAPAAQATVE